MPKLIYYDEAAHKGALRNGAEMADRLTDLLARFAALDLPTVAPIATADLPGLLADPRAWLVNRIFGNGALTLGGLTVNPQKALELVNLPAGFDEFIASAEEEARWMKSANSSYSQFPASSYAVSAAGQVSLAATAGAQLEARFKTYTTTAAQESLLADLTAVCTVLNRLRTGPLAGSSLLGGNTGGTLGNALIERTGGEPVRPNPDFITRNGR